MENDMTVQAKGWAGEIPVYCSFDEAVEIEKLKPNPKNSNMHPDEQIELLAAVIQKRGWRSPVTVSTRSGLVVRGHGRLMAAIHAGMSHVPVDFQHYDSEDAEMADLVADNKLAELAELDEKMLADIFANIDPDEVSLTGYDEDEILRIGDLLADSLMLDIDEVKSKSEVSTHKLKIDRTVIELAEDEYKMMMDELSRYVDMNGTTFGFVRWLFNDN
jgi:ParB-like chromosome segregation protein Spo0J